MKGSECRLIQFLEGSTKRFIIPVYQRSYKWKIEQCKQLYDDLVRLVKEIRSSHFFGSIVSQVSGNGLYSDYLIIDGQQRLTTVSLLLLAMYNLIEDGHVIPNDLHLSNRMFDYLVDKYQTENKRIKLKQIEDDSKAYGLLFDKDDEPIKSSNITSNYYYFYNRIKKQEITIDELFDSIVKLVIISITLDGDDDPQLIFESLNSTGLDLSEGDKIRNYILMSLSAKQQDDYYNRYWKQIETNTNFDVSSFVRDYLSVKTQKIPSQNKIYVDFKSYRNATGIRTIDLLEDLLAYAKRYKTLIIDNINNQNSEGKDDTTKYLEACIYRLNRIETTVTRPFFLEVLRLKDESKLTNEQVLDIFITTENYLLRRIICDLPTNVLNKIFLLLHKEIIRYDGTENDYVSKFKYALLSKKERSRFPDDEEFKKAFVEKQVYLMNPKNRVYLLERLENGGTKEDKDIYRHINDGNYSIEHIMPQHLTPTWQNELGEDYSQIHETWLHRIANLTLTAYNSEYSNRPYHEKKTREDGYVNSGLRLNTYFVNVDKWDLTALTNRANHLQSQALIIWPLATTDFVPKQKELEQYLLSDDSAIFTGRSIIKYGYKGNEYPVDSWKDMYVKVLRSLYEEDSSILIKLASSNEEGLAQHLTFNENEFTSEAEIANGIFVFTGTNTQSKLTNLQRVFSLYGIDENDLSFYLKEEGAQDCSELDESNKQFLKYWEAALSAIKEKDFPSFKNVDPSKGRWINGYIGISGVTITCVINNGYARVELCIANKDKSKNKECYDKLYKNKNEIETALGTSLTWERNDDYISSKVSISLNDFGIENEGAWDRIIYFHAKWSEQFYKVLTPYILL